MVSRVLHLYPIGEKWAVLRPSRGGREWLRSRGFPTSWSRRWRGFTVRTSQLGDVLAAADVDGWTVRRHGSLNDTAENPAPETDSNAKPQVGGPSDDDTAGNPAPETDELTLDDGTEPPPPESVPLAAVVASLGGTCDGCGRFICDCAREAS